MSNNVKYRQKNKYDRAKSKKSPPSHLMVW